VNAELAARMPARISLARVRPHLPLGAILALAAYLDFWNLGRNGYANTYYAAAVRSMLASWHNFFFASFDAGGLVSVDKPPLALWAEAASAKLFGYSGITILLPEALAGVVAVWLLYLTVARVFGRPAALVAALALALSPVSVAVNRDNNPDALFACLLVGAAYAGVRAVQSGRLRWLLGAAVLVGLAFNTKMLAAGIVVPGLAAAYALLAPHRWRARLAHVGLGGVVLVLVSGAWIAAVDLTPAVDRPYVGSTTDNSALSLALGYNGLGRVTGQEGGTSVGGGLGGAFSGTPGPLRLLNDALGDQGAWLLPLAIVGGLVALGLALRARRRPELATLTVLGGWFVAGAAVFSLSSGIIHTYYLSALAPATAALVGIGALALWRNARAGGRQLAFPLLALVATCWLEVALLRRSDYLPWLQALAIATTVAAALALALLAPGGVRPDRLRRLLATGALGIGLAGLLAAPAAWAATTLKAPVNGVFPGPGRASSAGSRRAAGHAASRADGSAAAARPRSSARGASLPRPEGSRASHPRPAASGPAGASRAGAGPVRPRAARSRTRLPTSAPTARRSASR